MEIRSDRLIRGASEWKKSIYLVKTGSCDPMIYMRATSSETVDRIRTDARGMMERFQ